MTEETKPCSHREVDAEIEALHDAYDAFRAMDRPAQIRCLTWLQERLASDTMSSALGKGTDHD